MSKRKQKTLQRRQPVWKCASAVLKVFFRKPKIVNLGGDIPSKAIYVANHSAMFGPLRYSLYMPVPISPWGAYPMLGKYKERYRYLRDVYFMQKRHKNKFAATFLAVFEAFFSIFFYRGINVIASYNDRRFIKTIRQSMRTLEQGRAIMIFPENSASGYNEKLTEFFAGFVELARYYKHVNGEDIPICPVYYHSKKRKMVIGKPSYLQQYLDEGLNRKQIAQDFCRQVNKLHDICVNDKSAAE